MTIAVLLCIVALLLISEFTTIDFKWPDDFIAVYAWLFRIVMMMKHNCSFYTGLCFDDAIYGYPWIFAFNDGDRCNLLWQCCIPPIAADVDEFFKY